jgi:hypothetical protein
VAAINGSASSNSSRARVAKRLPRTSWNGGGGASCLLKTVGFAIPLLRRSRSHTAFHDITAPDPPLEETVRTSWHLDGTAPSDPPLEETTTGLSGSLDTFVLDPPLEEITEASGVTAGRSTTCWAEFERISMQTAAGVHASKQAATSRDLGVDLTRRGRFTPFPWRPSS